MPLSAHKGPIVTCALLVQLCGVVSWSAHAEPPKQTITQTSPPAFDLHYQREGDANPGQFRYSASPDGPQIWTGIPHVIVRSDDSPAVESNNPPNPFSVTIPANPPTLTFDLAPDGSLTKVGPKK
ncbi:MAG: hypothetical protein H7834_06190 [Magnetococcus sp. YQC-9]